MFQRRQRRFRRRSNGRGRSMHGNDDLQTRIRPNSFSNGQTRNNLRSTQSAEKLFEKYSTLAKEALSTGDKTLSENYFQHADHFMRIIEDKNRIQKQSNVQPIAKETVSSESLSKNSSESVSKTIEEKKE